LAGDALSHGVIITARYSCVRHQGFVDTSTDSAIAPENAVMNYQVQQYRIFKQLAIAVALKFTGHWIVGRMRKDDNFIPDAKELSEVAATSGT